jgi:hypothetical protein
MVNDARLTAPGEPETLWRLYHGTAAVGFAKHWGANQMWSKTGAAYSGVLIEHSLELKALGLRTPKGDALFHGDVVSAFDEPEKRLILLGDEKHGVLIAEAGSPRLISHKKSIYKDRQLFTRHGSVVESLYLSRTFDPALRAMASRGFASKQLAWLLAVSIFGACLLMGALQFRLLNEVGPLTSCLGGVLAAWLFFIVWKRRAPQSFRRALTAKVAEQAALPLAGLFAASYASAGILGAPGIATGTMAICVGSFASFLFGLFFSMVSGSIAADTLTRRQDQRAGLQSELQSFLCSSPLFLKLVSREQESV